MDFWNVGILPQHYTASQPRRWMQHGPLKRWYPTPTLHGVTTKKTATWLSLWKPQISHLRFLSERASCSSQRVKHCSHRWGYNRTVVTIKMLKLDVNTASLHCCMYSVDELTADETLNNILPFYGRRMLSLPQISNVSINMMDSQYPNTSCACILNHSTRHFYIALNATFFNSTFLTSNWLSLHLQGRTK
jgi:hypothetical protein